MKAGHDNHLADHYENAWPSYNSLILQMPKATSTGRSIFDEPKETPIPNMDEECSLELHDAEDDKDSRASEEVEKPTFNMARQYYANYN